MRTKLIGRIGIPDTNQPPSDNFSRQWFPPASLPYIPDQESGIGEIHKEKWKDKVRIFDRLEENEVADESQ